MNEFGAKKLGEVLAFADVEHETWQKAKSAFLGSFDPEKVEAVIKTAERHVDAIHRLADGAGVLGTVTSKLESTGKKLREMRDLYIGDQWENPTELLEWSGFFEGAAVVHASLLTGVATEIGHSELLALAKEFLDSHKALLDEVTSLLHLVGRKKAN